MFWLTLIQENWGPAFTNSFLAWAKWDNFIHVPLTQAKWNQLFRTHFSPSAGELGPDAVAGHVTVGRDIDSATQLDAATADQVHDIAATVEVAVGATAQVNAATNDPIAETPKDDSQPTTKKTRCLSSDVWHYFDKIGVGNDGKETA
ncbi:hypothetical protein PIB30_038309 [Stylosanthes scabra]|uniref:Uncharacterized protein n=1 Tax=Stylosanthes scabra TaxID=79078 RepID=A0ABU6TG24_9FABA|nr:hypothetical protein [Stylosanthes scabra]